MNKMNVTMAAVCSINSKITKGEKLSMPSWASKEDAAHFGQLIADHALIVMGRKTYETIAGKVPFQKDKLRLVVTSNPDKFSEETQETILEFTNLPPNELVDSLALRGFKRMLLVGGSEIYSSFLAAGLVNEIYLTIEPLVFGTGLDMFSVGGFESQLKLISSTKLNDQGTVLLYYQVVKNSSV
jgi:dihydrofolate reductase